MSYDVSSTAAIVLHSDNIEDEFEKKKLEKLENAEISTMDFSVKQNPAPLIHDVIPTAVSHAKRSLVVDDDDDEEIDNIEIYDIIRTVQDPEHPYTLEQLSVVKPELISIDGLVVKVQFTPTIEHCSLATLIGLCIRIKLLRSLPTKYKVDISTTPGSHATEDQVNKQLADKERYSAAMENPNLASVVERCIREPES